jgi:hypothetical protein
MFLSSTPVECGRSRATAQRSELAGWAKYGYCDRDGGTLAFSMGAWRAFAATVKNGSAA